MISAEKGPLSSYPLLTQTRPARRSLLRCEQTRKEAIFLRRVTFDEDPRKFFGTEGETDFIVWLSDGVKQARLLFKGLKLNILCWY